jgi:hypothetical protein
LRFRLNIEDPVSGTHLTVARQLAADSKDGAIIVAIEITIVSVKVEASRDWITNGGQSPSLLELQYEIFLKRIPVNA